MQGDKLYDGGVGPVKVKQAKNRLWSMVWWMYMWENTFKCVIHDYPLGGSFYKYLEI